MNDSYFSRRALVALIVAVSLFAVIGIAVASNLLVNGGFNAAFAPQAVINGVVPSGWTAINLYGNPKWIDSAAFCNCGGNNEKTEGTNAVVVEAECRSCSGVQWTSGWPFTAVLVQQVNGVAGGSDYAFAASLLTLCGGSALPSACDSRGYTMTKQVGIDPIGGTSPTAPSVVWSSPDGVDHRWADLSVASKAQSSALSVFIKVTWPYTMDRSHTYWDAAYLTLAPTATLSAAAVGGSGAMSVNWSGRAPQDVSGYYPGIKLGFDVQVRKLPSEAWTNILTTTQLASTMYSSAPGTYQFRALPVLFQQDTPQDDATRRFVGLYTDPVSVVNQDVTAPSSAVAPLASLQTTPSFTVSWSGTDDVSRPSALRYDVQSRDGNGAWTDWQVNTQATSATFNGVAGHSYSFRSRARDEAGNLEAYPTNADAVTTVVVGSVAGTIRNVRAQPIPVAAPSLTPAAASGALSDALGQYTLYVTANNTYALNVTRAGFGALPPIGNLVVSNNNLAGVDVILPPRTDLFVNGQFEVGNLSGWTPSALNAPTISAAAHSGGYAAQLSTSLPVTDSTLQQTLFISPTLSAPTLSYLYRSPSGVSVPFKVSVTNGSTIAETTPSIAGANWTHGWLDLTPFSGQTVTVVLRLQGTALPSSLVVDEVEVGSAETNTAQQFLPLINR